MEHFGESLQAGIHAGERLEVVQGMVAKAGDDPGQRAIQLDDINEIAVLIQLRSGEQHFYPVRVAVLGVLSSPVAADQVVLGDEIAVTAS
jgi:hypothetical protein